MTYSVVAPFFNEEKAVRPLHDSLKRVMDSLGAGYEIIFINDGSTDKTGEILLDISRNDKAVTVIHNRLRMGQTASLRLGFEAAAGDIVISMDGDMQNDPDDIPALIAELKKGFDFVCGWRYARKDPVSKKAASWFGNLAQKLVFNSGLHDISCTLRAYTKDSIRALPLKKEGAHRFIPYLLMIKGKKPSEVKVHHRLRPYGRTKYGFTRSFKVAYDFLTLLFNRRSWI
jgi:glycosyltransferase involved in cell wall biosynthesis